MPLLRLGSPSSKMNALQMQLRPGPRSRKPLKSHLPPMMQQHKLKLPSLRLTKTGRTPWDLTNISPHSPFSLSILESPTTMPCQNGSLAASSHRSQYSLLSQEQSKPLPLWRNFTTRPLRLKEATATSPHLGEDPNTVDVDSLMLSPVVHACHMHENCCFICHKEGCSTRNYIGYDCGHPTGSWCTNPKPSQTAHARAVSTTHHLAPTPSYQDDLLDSFLKDITKT